MTIVFFIGVTLIVLIGLGSIVSRLFAPRDHRVDYYAVEYIHGDKR